MHCWVVWNLDILLSCLVVGVVWSGLGVLWSYYNFFTQFALVQILVVGRKMVKGPRVPKNYFVVFI